jgi:DNA-binding XRE family transcriptional regulator
MAETRSLPGGAAAPLTPPTKDDLSPDGEGQEVLTQGMTMALAALVIGLKSRREQRGLTLADVSRRSGLTIQTLSRLENHDNRNPTLDSVFRYAMAMDCLVTLGTEEIEPAEEEGPDE